MSNIFRSLSRAKVRYSKFDLGHEKKLSMQMGELVPMMCQEVVPGDNFRNQTEVFARLQALLSPVMHRVDVTCHFWFVPTRIIWDEFDDFITGGRTGTLAPVHPFLTISNANKAQVGAGTLADYLGVPDLSGATINNNVNISALPFRAYQLIYDEFYRDDVLTAPVNCPRTSGDQTGLFGTHVTLRKSAWEKDYFTSARPAPQLGAEVVIPSNNSVTYMNQSLVKTTPGVNANANTNIGTGGTAGLMNVNKTTLADGTSGRIENIQAVNTNITVNNLRKSLRIQEWLEKNMRAGARYVEQVLSHFGVVVPDYRISRPEYLGGGKQRFTLSEVLQTAEGTNPVGTMNGHGYAVANTNRFKQRFTEHGFVIGIIRVLPRTAYQQGLDRMWTRFDKLDYYFPEFANLGEQEIKNQEIYLDPSLATAGDTWGYQQRYAEYKYQPSTVHGDFKSSLSFWHMGRIFTSLPPLNTNFVEADPTQRIFAVTNPAVDKVLIQLYHQLDAVRPMPYYSVPSITQ